MLGNLTVFGAASRRILIGGGSGLSEASLSLGLRIRD